MKWLVSNIPIYNFKYFVGFVSRTICYCLVLFQERWINEKYECPLSFTLRID
jgi:hypothetical protein